MNLSFNVDLSRSFARGVECPIVQPVSIEVDPSSLTQEDRDAIASRLTQEGVVRSRATQVGNNYSSLDNRTTYRDPITSPEPTVAGLLEAIRDEDRKWDASCRQYAANIESEIEQYVSDPMALVRPTYSRHTPSIDGTPQWGVNEHIGAYAQSRSDDPRVVEARRIAKAEANRRNDELHQARRDRIADEAAERAAWIDAHGSRRLKRLVAEGIGHTKTYRAERDKWDRATKLEAYERGYPGWQLIQGTPEEVSDVGSRSLALLDAARAMIGDAYVEITLRKWQGRVVAAIHMGDEWLIWPNEQQ